MDPNQPSEDPGRKRTRTDEDLRMLEDISAPNNSLLMEQMMNQINELRNSHANVLAAIDALSTRIANNANITNSPPQFNFNNVQLETAPSGVNPATDQKPTPAPKLVPLAASIPSMPLNYPRHFYPQQYTDNGMIFNSLKEYNTDMSFRSWIIDFEHRCRIARVPDDLKLSYLAIYVGKDINRQIQENDHMDYDQLIDHLENSSLCESHKIDAEQKLDDIRETTIKYDNVKEKVTKISDCISVLRPSLSSYEHLKEVKYIVKSILPPHIKVMMFNENIMDLTLYVSEIKRAFSLNKNKFSKPNNNSVAPDITCSRCNYRGHKREDCKSKYKWDKEKKIRVALLTFVEDSASCILLTDVSINNMDIISCVDTCSTISVICSKLARNLGLPIAENKVEVGTIGDTPAYLKSIETPVTIFVKGKPFIINNCYTTRIADGSAYQFLLGKDVLGQTDYYISLKENSLLSREEAIDSLQSTSPSNKVRINNSSISEIVESDKVIEVTPITMVIDKKIQSLYEIEENKIKEKFASCFEVEIKPKLKSGLQEFDTSKEMKRFQFYKVPHHQQKYAQRIIDKYVKNGMVKKEMNPFWIHPVMLISKKVENATTEDFERAPEDHFRLVVDLRMVNSQTVKQTGGNVNTMIELQRIPGNKKLIYSMIDLKNAFQQILIDPMISPKFSFSIDGVTNYSYTTLGQGALNSPFQFALKISQVFEQEKNNNSIIQYMDDLLLVSSVEKHESDEELIRKHTELLQNTLNKIIDNGLRCNLMKCKLYRKELVFLAYSLTQNGYQPSVASVEKLVRQVPKDRAALTRFLFGTNYFRPVLNNFPKLSRCLFELTSKKVPFIMGEKEKENYQKIIDELLSLPTIGFPVEGWQYILKSDASNTNLGICIIQENPKNKEERILIGLANIALEDTVKARHSSYLELKGICAGLDTFSYMLKGAPSIRIETDHLPLLPIVKNSSCHRYAELLSFLSSYPATFTYVPGPLHVVPDFLSRLVDYTLVTGEKEIFIDNNTHEVALVEPYNKIFLEELNQNENICKVKDSLAGTKFTEPEKTVLVTMLTSNTDEIKRKRGRPPKKLFISDKRKRGRPKKLNNPIIIDKTNESNKVELKRPVGRPRKVISLASSPNMNTVVEVKRKRGRPKKDVTTVTELEVRDVEPTRTKTRGRPRIEIPEVKEVTLMDYFQTTYKNIDIKTLQDAIAKDSKILEALDSPMACYKDMPLSRNEHGLITIECGSDYVSKNLNTNDSDDCEINYHLFPINGGKVSYNRLYIPDSYAPILIKTIHDNGHFGYSKVKDTFKQVFYTNRLHHHISVIITQCITCNLHNPKPKSSNFNRTITLPDNPMTSLAVDIIVPKIHCTDFQFILAVTDLHSRYTWLIPLKDKDIHKITDLLFSEILLQFGFVQRIHCDNESIFRSAYFTNALATVGIEISYGTPNYSKSNCIIENKIRTINLLMAKLSESNLLWTNALKLTMYHLNNMKRGKLPSPFEIMFLRFNRTGLQKLDKETLKYLDHSDAFTDLLTQADFIRDTIKHVDEELRQDSNNKKHTKIKNFKEGDAFVYKKKRTHKFDTRYNGPFLVDKVLSKSKIQFISSSGRTLTASLEKIVKIELNEEERQKLLKKKEVLEEDHGSDKITSQISME